MSDTGNENEQPFHQLTFGETVARFNAGQGTSLRSLHVDNSLTKLRSLDLSLPGIFFGKAKFFFKKTIAVASEYHQTEEERTETLTSIFREEIGSLTEPTVDYAPSLIYSKIMKLGALIFVGETHEIAVGEGEITSALQQMVGLHLTNLERELVGALANGMEVGYKDSGVEKFKQLVEKIKEKAGQRSQVPEQELPGDDFIEALLTANL